MQVAALAEQLTRLGIPAGGLLMVHASLRAVGPVHCGAAGVIDALTQALGPAGTLLMVLGADEDEPFDALTSEVDVEDMGVLPEVFRTTDGVAVSDHAAARFAARGPLADELLRDPPLHHYYDAGSTLERFLAHEGQVLRLGANIDTVTLTHYSEYQANVPHKRFVRRRYVRADTGEQWIDSLDDTDGIVDWAHGDYFSALTAEFLTTDATRTGPVGGCVAELFDGRTYDAFARRWMERHLA